MKINEALSLCIILLSQILFFTDYIILQQSAIILFVVIVLISSKKQSSAISFYTILILLFFSYIITLSLYNNSDFKRIAQFVLAYFSAFVLVITHKYQSQATLLLFIKIISSTLLITSLIEVISNYNIFELWDGIFLFGDISEDREKSVSFIGMMRPRIIFGEPSWLAVFVSVLVCSWFKLAKNANDRLVATAFSLVFSLVISSPILLFTCGGMIMSLFATRKGLLYIILGGITLAVIATSTDNIISQRLEGLDSETSSEYIRLVMPYLLLSEHSSFLDILIGKGISPAWHDFVENRIDAQQSNFFTLIDQFGVLLTALLIIMYFRAVYINFNFFILDFAVAIVILFGFGSLNTPRVSCLVGLYLGISLLVRGRRTQCS